MIKRTWFFKVESVPTVKQSRVDKGFVTECTGFISYRSFTVDYNYIKSTVLKMVETDDKSFHEEGLILSVLSRV